jgi:hypothetical protein
MSYRLLSIVAVFVVLGLWLSAGNEDATDEAPAPTSVETAEATRSERIDPTPYRRAIRAVDEIAYSPEPPDYGTAERAADAIARVGREVVQSTRDPRERRLGQSILALSQRVGATSDVGYAMPDRVKIRRDWEAVRNEVFERSTWFRGNLAESSAGGGTPVDAKARMTATIELDDAQRTPSPAAITRAEHRKYRRLITTLERASSRGRSKCASLGEPDYDISVPSSRAERHVARWDAWSRTWQEDLHDAWEDAPRTPSFTEQVELVRCYQNLEKALRQLQLVPRGAGAWPTPFERQWTQRFDQAEALLSSAKDDLDGVRVE